MQTKIIIEDSSHLVKNISQAKIHKALFDSFFYWRQVHEWQLLVLKSYKGLVALQFKIILSTFESKLMNCILCSYQFY